MKGLLIVATTFLTIIFLIALLVSFSMIADGSGGTEGSGLASLSFIIVLLTGALAAIGWYLLRKMNREE